MIHRQLRHQGTWMSNSVDRLLNDQCLCLPSTSLRHTESPPPPPTLVRTQDGDATCKYSWIDGAEPKHQYLRLSKFSLLKVQQYFISVKLTIDIKTWVRCGSVLRQLGQMFLLPTTLLEKQKWVLRRGNEPWKVDHTNRETQKENSVGN